MKKLLVVAIVVVVSFVLSVSAFAVPGGKTVEFDGKGAGKVVFDGKVHADKGLKSRFASALADHPSPPSSDPERCDDGPFDKARRDHWVFCRGNH